MEIYQASIKDIKGIAYLFDLYRVFYKQESNLQEAEAFLLERFHNQDSVIFVAVDQGEFVGFIQLYPSFSSVSMKRLWILNDLYVIKSARKKGVATRLLDAAKEYARQTGAKGLTLQTVHDNLTAQQLYEQYGYRQDHHCLYYVLDL